MYRNFSAFLMVLFILALSTDARASLLDRGNGMIYDSDTNLTWLKDTRYPFTIGFQGTLVRDSYGRTQPSVDEYGRMNWSEAMRFASELSFGGYNDWRLPKQGIGPAVFQDRHSELAVMFYNSLGNQGAYIDGAVNYSPHGLINQGPFLFDSTMAFWTGETDAYGDAWVFDLVNGFSGTTDKSDIFTHLGAWAVRDGDVANSVPEPSSISLLLLSAAGLIVGTRWRQRC